MTNGFLLYNGERTINGSFLSRDPLIPRNIWKILFEDYYLNCPPLKKFFFFLFPFLKLCIENFLKEGNRGLVFRINR